VQPDIGAIAGAALELAERAVFASFKVETRRSSKKHPFTSPEVNQAVGAAIQAKTSARVDLTKPEQTFWVDVLQDEALVASEQLKGFGGLPVGSSGRALCLFSGGIDSPVAAFLAMQRGLKVGLVHFSAFPYVRFVNEEKQRLLAERIALFQGQPASTVSVSGRCNKGLPPTFPRGCSLCLPGVRCCALRQRWLSALGTGRCLRARAWVRWHPRRSKT